MKTTVINIITVVFVLGASFFVLLHNSTVFDTYVQPKIHVVADNTLPEPLTKIDAHTLIPKGGVIDASAISASGIIDETNNQRVQQKEKALTENKNLDASAQVKADDILKRQYFEHTSPDGRTVSDLTKDQGYAYIKIGENLALGNFKDNKDVLQAWMNSPSHRANILDTTYTEIGVGVAHGTYQGYEVSVLVQHFGRPLTDCPMVDGTLKAAVDTGEANLASLSTKLDGLRKSIDEGRARFKNMDSIVAIYNQGVEQYTTEFASVDALRIKYNNQVAVFNDCVK
ncbi:MAG: CAP domain-containing protein [bacterium]